MRSWTIKKAECWKINAFELWCWRRLLRVLKTARLSNQSILKEINPNYSLEGLMLKLQCFGHLVQRANLSEKTLMLGKIEGILYSISCLYYSFWYLSSLIFGQWSIFTLVPVSFWHEPLTSLWEFSCFFDIQNVPGSSLGIFCPRMKSATLP